MNILDRLAARVVLKLRYRVLEHRARSRIEGLTARGMIVGNNVSIHWSAVIDDNYPYLISIGDNCYVCDGTCLIAHDAAIVKATDHYVRLGKIQIKDNCYIGPKCMILPGVTIGPNVIVEAGSFVNRDIPANSYVAGVPARVCATFDEMIEGHRMQIGERPVFQYEEVRSKASKEVQRKVRNAARDGDIYVLGFKNTYPTLINAEPG